MAQHPAYPEAIVTMEKEGETIQITGGYRARKIKIAKKVGGHRKKGKKEKERIEKRKKNKTDKTLEIGENKVGWGAAKKNIPNYTETNLVSRLST